MKGNYWLSLN